MAKIYFHTSAPSPYRKHLFEMLAKEIPGCVFLFSFPFKNDRPWDNSFDDWKCECRWVAGWREVKELLSQRWGTVHIYSCCNSRFYYFLLLLSALIRHSKVMIWDDARLLGKIKSTSELSWLKRFRRRIYVSLFVGIFTAGKLGASAARKVGFSTDKIVNTYFSHDIDKYAAYWETHHRDSRLLVRSKLGIPDDHICVLNISRYLSLKRLDDLAESVCLLEEQRPDLAKKCEIVLIGDGECKSHMPIFGKLKVVKVHFIKPMPSDEVLDYYCAADLFVFPSEGDIWGLVVNEALSMGVPVICTDKIGASEMVVDGENGYVIPVRCPDLITEKIIKYIENSELRGKLKKNALTIRNKWKSDFGVTALRDYLIKLGGVKSW